MLKWVIKWSVTDYYFSPACVHTHTYTHTHYARTQHAHTHACTDMCTHTNTHTHTNTRTHTTHTHIHTHRHTHAHIHITLYTQEHMYIRTSITTSAWDCTCGLTLCLANETFFFKLFHLQKWSFNYSNKAYTYTVVVHDGRTAHDHVIVGTHTSPV